VVDDAVDGGGGGHGVLKILSHSPKTRLEVMIMERRS
jgi:hypothetical protein